jgi:transketolase
VGARGREARLAWEERWSALDEGKRSRFVDPVGGRAAVAIAEAKHAFAADTKPKATRVWSQLTLERLAPAIPTLIGGSADLTGSNGTRTPAQKVITREDFSGAYVHYGVREHAMAAAMNGLALHGGIVPYGGTFLAFSDYCRPAIRLAALSGLRVIHVMTHDSIGLGEDGPTHQPIEHLASLRAVPNLLVLRPADGIETAECWEIALGAQRTPSILALTRQPVAAVRTEGGGENLCAKGAYVVREAAPQRDLTLIASGSEVGLAMRAAETLVAEGIAAAVVSMPSFELFRAQPTEYRRSVLGDAPRIGIEAAVGQGWCEWLREQDMFIGLSAFGASAPAAQVFAHFGLTENGIVAAARRLTR